MQKKVRLWIGGSLAAAAIVAVLLAAVVPFMGLSGGKTAAVIAALVIAAEVLAAVALLVLGKEIYRHIQAKLRELKEKAAQ